MNASTLTQDMIAIYIVLAYVIVILSYAALIVLALILASFACTRRSALAMTRILLPLTIIPLATTVAMCMVLVAAREGSFNSLATTILPVLVLFPGLLGIRKTCTKQISHVAKMRA